MGKDSPSPPPAPDYTGAAQATSQGTVQAAIANNLMAHPNIYTPLGSQTWSPTGSTSIPSVGGQPGFDVPTYSQSINMTPQGQSLYNQGLNLDTGLMSLGQGSLDQTRASLGQPQDFSSVGDIADQSYKAQTARLDPQWDQRKGAFDQQMANQGITAGGEAYDNASRDFGQQRNDAYTQARQAAIATMPQTYQLAAAQRMQPLTELNAIRTGAQPQMPQFQPTQYAGGVQGPNMTGATQGQNQYNMGLYNSQVGSANSANSGMLQTAGTIAAAMMMSDRRTKKNIKEIGEDPRGFGIYKFNYLWDKKGEEKHIGVMADEVEKVIPEAVADIGGVKAVDYGRL